MTTIVATNMQGDGGRALTKTILDGVSDTFDYKKARNQVLVLDNVTGGALSPVITGGAATTVQCAGVGSIDVTGGYAVGSIAAGDLVAIPVNSISGYLAGTIDIDAAVGIEAYLLEF